jgi:hypothetical protein
MEETDKIKIIDKVIDTIKYSEDSFIFNDFNTIYDSYKKIYGELK